MAFKPGDRVAVLDEALSGWVVNANKGIVTVEFEDGFQLDYEAHQLIHEGGNQLASSAGPSKMTEAEDGHISKPKSKRIFKKKPKADATVVEIDLHIDKLLPSTKGMDKHDIRTFQLETANKQLEFAIRNRIPRLIFIHGVGEGILKTELQFLLGRYEGISFSEASYRKYGMGATEVSISQNARRT